MHEPIVHYGVKGMRWGVRKQHPTLSGKRKGKADARRIYEKIAGKKEAQSINPRRKQVSEMSDDELRKVVSRMQMERTYSQLTQKEVTKGRKFVNEVLYNSVKSVATTYAIKAMAKTIEKLLRNSSSSRIS